MALMLRDHRAPTLRNSMVAWGWKGKFDDAGTCQSACESVRWIKLLASASAAALRRLPQLPNSIHTPQHFLKLAKNKIKIK
jgi:hypothetical protein